MDIASLEALAAEIIKHAATSNIPLKGPIEIEYGWGWAPTITFWSGSRRIHFYFDLYPKGPGATVEASEMHPGRVVTHGLRETDSDIRFRLIETSEEVLKLVDEFFTGRCSLESLPGAGWMTTTLDHDKFIPHPPDKSNAANIVEVVKKGKPTDDLQTRKAK